MIALLQHQQELHNHAVEVSGRIRSDGALLVRILQKIDQTKLYKKFQRESLFQYACHELKMERAEAYSFITVARKANQIPSLSHAVQSLSLSVTKASRIVSALTEKNGEKLVQFAIKNSVEKINREVAKLNPRSRSLDKVKYLSENVVQLTITISKNDFDNLGRAEAVAAQKGKKFSGRGEMIGLALSEYVERHDPLKKAERAKQKKAQAARQQVAAGSALASRSSVSLSSVPASTGPASKVAISARSKAASKVATSANAASKVAMSGSANTASKVASPVSELCLLGWTLLAQHATG